VRQAQAMWEECKIMRMKLSIELLVVGGCGASCVAQVQTILGWDHCFGDTVLMMKRWVQCQWFGKLKGKLDVPWLKWVKF